MYQTHWSKWSKDDVTKLRNDFIQGKSIKEIASKLNRNQDAVAFRLIKIGILGYPEDKLMENSGTLWSEQEKNNLLKEYKSGMSIEQMAKAHKRNKNAILTRLIECRAFDYTNRKELERYVVDENKGLVGTVDIDNKQKEGGDAKMSFARVPFNTTPETPEKGLLSGRRDAAYYRNIYQKELDNANAAIINMVHYCEEENEQLKNFLNKAESLKATISAHEKEREQAYNALGNLLNKETDFEKFMHKETTGMYKEVSKNQKTEDIKIKQRNIASDNEFRFASMLKYVEKYPEYQSKSSFKTLLEKIDAKERELRRAKEEYNTSVAKYHEKLQAFKIYNQKAKDKIDVYYKLQKEGNEKIQSTRYVKGPIFKHFTSERRKAEVLLNTINHRIEQFENTLKIISEELSQYEGRKFKELDY